MILPTLEEYSKKYQHIKFHREDGILQLTLHSDNADLVWGFAPHQELGYAFADIAADPENKVIIFTGSGETFIHKEDLGGGGVTAKIWAEHVLPDAKRLLTNLLEIQAPMIAAVNGPATVHAELALLCDIVLAADVAKGSFYNHFTDKDALAREIAADNDLRAKRIALDTLVGRNGVAPKPLLVPVVLPAVPGGAGSRSTRLPARRRAAWAISCPAGRPGCGQDFRE
jgi:hypothetical protein